MSECPDRGEAIAGVILGTAAGDALGLPREGLGRRRARRLFGPPPLRHRFFLGRGTTSDDTEHTCLVGQALLRAPDEAARFGRALARGLRYWLLGLPAGIGRATLQGIVRLWLGFSPERSGVRSAGNGPAMRSALLGVCFGEDAEKLRAYVRACTRLTHTDPRAEQGAHLVALAAHLGAREGAAEIGFREYLALVQERIPDLHPELRTALELIEEHLARQAPASALAEAMGLGRGVSGYVCHTVPVALFCWLRQPGDFRAAVEEVIDLGGDSDTTGAIVGALMGATVGAGGIPGEWLEGLWEWPRSVAWMRTLAGRLARRFPASGAGEEQRPVFLFWPGVLVRNLFFLLVVLLHVLRRLLPPY